LIGPGVASAGTSVTILANVSEIIVAVTPLNVTLVAPARFFPLMITFAPGAPDGGRMLVISGVTLVVILPIELLP